MGAWTHRVNGNRLDPKGARCVNSRAGGRILRSSKVVRFRKWARINTVDRRHPLRHMVLQLESFVQIVHKKKGGLYSLRLLLLLLLEIMLLLLLLPLLYSLRLLLLVLLEIMLPL